MGDKSTENNFPFVPGLYNQNSNPTIRSNQQLPNVSAAIPILTSQLLQEQRAQIQQQLLVQQQRQATLSSFLINNSINAPNNATNADVLGNSLQLIQAIAQGAQRSNTPGSSLGNQLSSASISQSRLTNGQSVTIPQLSLSNARSTLSQVPMNMNLQELQNLLNDNTQQISRLVTLAGLSNDAELRDIQQALQNLRMTSTDRGTMDTATLQSLLHLVQQAQQRVQNSLMASSTATVQPQTISRTSLTTSASGINQFTRNPFGANVLRSRAFATASPSASEQRDSPIEQQNMLNGLDPQLAAALVNAKLDSAGDIVAAQQIIELAQAQQRQQPNQPIFQHIIDQYRRVLDNVAQQQAPFSERIGGQTLNDTVISSTTMGSQQMVVAESYDIGEYPENSLYANEDAPLSPTDETMISDYRAPLDNIGPEYTDSVEVTYSDDQFPTNNSNYEDGITEENMPYFPEENDALIDVLRLFSQKVERTISSQIGTERSPTPEEDENLTEKERKLLQLCLLNQLEQKTEESMDAELNRPSSVKMLSKENCLNILRHLMEKSESTLQTNGQLMVEKVQKSDRAQTFRRRILSLFHRNGKLQRKDAEAAKRNAQQLLRQRLASTQRVGNNALPKKKSPRRPEYPNLHADEAELEGLHGDEEEERASYRRTPRNVSAVSPSKYRVTNSPSAFLPNSSIAEPPSPRKRGRPRLPPNASGAPAQKTAKRMDASPDKLSETVELFLKPPLPGSTASAPSALSPAATSSRKRQVGPQTSSRRKSKTDMPSPVSDTSRKLKTESKGRRKSTKLRAGAKAISRLTAEDKQLAERFRDAYPHKLSGLDDAEVICAAMLGYLRYYSPDGDMERCEDAGATSGEFYAELRRGHKNIPDFWDDFLLSVNEGKDLAPEAFDLIGTVFRNQELTKLQTVKMYSEYLQKRFSENDKIQSIDAVQKHIRKNIQLMGLHISMAMRRAAFVRRALFQHTTLQLLNEDYGKAFDDASNRPREMIVDRLTELHFHEADNFQARNGQNLEHTADRVPTVEIESRLQDQMFRTRSQRVAIEANSPFVVAFRHNMPMNAEEQLIFRLDIESVLDNVVEAVSSGKPYISFKDEQKVFTESPYASEASVREKVPFVGKYHRDKTTSLFRPDEMIQVLAGARKNKSPIIAMRIRLMDHFHQNQMELRRLNAQCCRLRHIANVARRHDPVLGASASRRMEEKRGRRCCSVEPSRDWPEFLPLFRQRRTRSLQSRGKLSNVVVNVGVLFIQRPELPKTAQTYRWCPVKIENILLDRVPKIDEERNRRVAAVAPNNSLSSLNEMDDDVFYPSKQCVLPPTTGALRMMDSRSYAQQWLRDGFATLSERYATLRAEQRRIAATLIKLTYLSVTDTEPEQPVRSECGSLMCTEQFDETGEISAAKGDDGSWVKPSTPFSFPKNPPSIRLNSTNVEAKLMKLARQPGVASNAEGALFASRGRRSIFKKSLTSAQSARSRKIPFLLNGPSRILNLSRGLKMPLREANALLNRLCGSNLAKDWSFEDASAVVKNQENAILLVNKILSSGNKTSLDKLLNANIDGVREARFDAELSFRRLKAAALKFFAKFDAKAHQAFVRHLSTIQSPRLDVLFQLYDEATIGYLYAVPTYDAKAMPLFRPGESEHSPNFILGPSLAHFDKIYGGRENNPYRQFPNSSTLFTTSHSNVSSAPLNKYRAREADSIPVERLDQSMNLAICARALMRLLVMSEKSDADFYAFVCNLVNSDAFAVLSESQSDDNGFPTCVKDVAIERALDYKRNKPDLSQRKAPDFESVEAEDAYYKERSLRSKEKIKAALTKSHAAVCLGRRFNKTVARLCGEPEHRAAFVRGIRRHVASLTPRNQDKFWRSFRQRRYNFHTQFDVGSVPLERHVNAPLPVPNFDPPELHIFDQPIDVPELVRSDIQRPAPSSSVVFTEEYGRPATSVEFKRGRGGRGGRGSRGGAHGLQRGGSRGGANSLSTSLGTRDSDASPIHSPAGRGGRPPGRRGAASNRFSSKTAARGGGRGSHSAIGTPRIGRKVQF